MLTDTFKIRKVSPSDNQQLANIIRTVMTDFGACGAGFSIHDKEVDHIFESYQGALHAYFVVVSGKNIMGGAGIGPLIGGESSICELKKMYFLEEVRGHGMGQKLIDACLQEARLLGYQQCYIETLESMKAANYLYQKNGFTPLTSPLGNTGHFSCDRYYIKQLN